MRFMRVLLISLFFIPTLVRAEVSEFTVAAQLLAAAKNGDIQQVQVLINNGANINFVDSTGLSIVCTALMNNDVRAAQILQMYGADASQCDRQIKQYNQRNKPQSSGGLFSGLSSAQSITLTAAGAAVIVGGLYFLTDWLNPGNDNDTTSSSGNGSHGGGSSGTVTTGNEAFKLAKGPAELAESYNYTNALDYYSPSSTSSILNQNFAKMNAFAGGQNYMLMMHGYSPLARGYLGQRTLRNSSNNAPLPLINTTSGNYLYNFDGQSVQGGAPVNVAIVTPNGVNAAVDTSLGEFNETTNQYDFILFSTPNGTGVNSANNNMIFSKFYNNTINLGGDSTTLADDTITENASQLSYFDWSGFGTAIHNPDATATDDMLAKIVGGRDAGYSTPDYFGFMPNGQMTIFRTGNGTGMINPTTPVAGTFTSLNVGGELNFGGLSLTIDTVTDNTNVGGIKTFVAKDTSDNEYAGYIGTNGYLYIDSDADDVIDQAYSLDTDGLTMTLVKERGAIDYANYDALLKGAQWSDYDIDYGRRSKIDILANATVVDGLHSVTAKTVDDVLALNPDNYVSNFTSMVNGVYDNTGANAVGGKAVAFFGGLGSSYSPLVIFSTGAVETDSTYSGATKVATFENAAPLVFDNLEHLFMSVVAVGTTNSTADQSNVSTYSPGGYSVMQWADTSGASPTYYKSRVCGVAGVGGANIDPWCFATAGATDALAVASAAGAAGAVKAAFNYLSNQQLFVLLALTADGPLLATDSSGYAYTAATLTNNLKTLYTLPYEYQFRVDNGEDYLSVFREVFGYGMINLERATTPGKTVYYYGGTANNPDIVSVTSGNSYWRAASNTAVRVSSALPIRATTLTTSAYDVVESLDGSMSLPRIWENSFALGNQSRHALYMGDVLGELKTRRDGCEETKIGNMNFYLGRSERAYNDNMGGLDELRLGYDSGAFHVAADYQHYLTDGNSRFNGMANPVLGLVSNAVTTGFAYDMGNWTFGTRAFSGAITNDGLLENDPTISSQYMPATLGLANGVMSSVAWNNDKFGATVSFGNMHESDTLLGAKTDGLLSLGAGNTNYVDAELRYSPIDNVLLKLRGTYARTESDGVGMFVSNVSAIESNAFAFGADIGNFSFVVSRPLAAYSGTVSVPYAHYAVVEDSNGSYDIDVVDTGTEKLRFGSDKRELRLSGEYRHSFGEFTDGAFGFIYRVNPNNTDEFGNESIFMLKLNHRIGI